MSQLGICSNNKVTVKVVKEELRVNFRFHSITGVRKSFSDGQYPELLVFLILFTESNEARTTIR
jgi:hypothetical protein